jgi:hypothetical protein
VVDDVYFAASYVKANLVQLFPKDTERAQQELARLHGAGMSRDNSVLIDVVGELLDTAQSLAVRSAQKVYQEAATTGRAQVDVWAEARQQELGVRRRRDER